MLLAPRALAVTCVYVMWFHTCGWPKHGGREQNLELFHSSRQEIIFESTTRKETLASIFNTDATESKFHSSDIVVLSIRLQARIQHSISFSAQVNIN